MPAKFTCLMLRYGQGGLGLGERCQHKFRKPLCQWQWGCENNCVHRAIKAVRCGNNVSKNISLLCAQVRAPCIDFIGACLYINHQCCKMPYFYITCSSCRFITFITFADTAFSPGACVCKSCKPACFLCVRYSNHFKSMII